MFSEENEKQRKKAEVEFKFVDDKLHDATPGERYIDLCMHSPEHW